MKTMETVKYARAYALAASYSYENSYDNDTTGCKLWIESFLLFEKCRCENFVGSDKKMIARRANCIRKNTLKIIMKEYNNALKSENKNLFEKIKLYCWRCIELALDFNFKHIDCSKSNLEIKI